MVSLRRRRAATSAVAGGLEETRPVRPRGEWTRVDPMPSASRRERGVVPHAAFKADLATAWSTPPALQPLGHHLSLDAPTGLLTAHVSRVTAYDGAPLRFAPAATEDADATAPVSWAVPQTAAAPTARAPVADAGQAARPTRSLLDRVLRRPAPSAPLVDSVVHPGIASAAAGRDSSGSSPVEPLSARPPNPPVAPVPPVVPEPRNGAARRPGGGLPAGPLRFAAASVHADLDGPPPGPDPWPDLPGTADPRPEPAALSGPAVQARPHEWSGPAPGTEAGTPAGPLRPVAPIGRVAPPVTAVQADSAVPDARDQSGGPLPGSVVVPVAGQQRSRPHRADETVEVPASRANPVAAEPVPTRPLPSPAAVPDAVRPAARADASTPERMLVGRRPLGGERLDALRAAATPRPVSAFAPAVLPDAVVPRRAAHGSATSAARPTMPVFPALSLPALTHASAARPDGDLDPSAPAPAHADALESTQQPGRAAPAEPQPGLPDWWPVESATWSVRDVDPLQISPADSPEPTAEASAPAVPFVADEQLVLRQQVRPTRDLANGVPVGRRVAWPATAGADEPPALRQVHRGRREEQPPAAEDDPEVDPHLPLPERVADAPGLPLLPDHDDRGDPGRPDRAHSPAPAPARSDAASPPTREEVAEHVRHALLVERERSGALSDEW